MLRRRHTLLSLSKIFYKYLLGPFGLWCLLHSIFFSVLFFLNDLLIGESGEIKSPIICVWGSKCYLSCSGISFTYMGVLMYGAKMSVIEMPSWWIWGIFVLKNMECLYLLYSVCQSYLCIYSSYFLFPEFPQRGIFIIDPIYIFRFSTVLSVSFNC